MLLGHHWSGIDCALVRRWLCIGRVLVGQVLFGIGQVLVRRWSGSRGVFIRIAFQYYTLFYLVGICQRSLEKEWEKVYSQKKRASNAIIAWSLMPFMLRTTQYIPRLYSKTLATLYLWSIGLLSGLSGQKSISRYAQTAHKPVQVQQSRKQVLKAYCSNIYILCLGLGCEWCLLLWLKIVFWRWKRQVSHSK